ncbi:MAG: hypothetical protein U0528_09275 [Anaerolineae bacterium]
MVADKLAAAGRGAGHVYGRDRRAATDREDACRYPCRAITFPPPTGRRRPRDHDDGHRRSPQGVVADALPASWDRQRRGHDCPNMATLPRTAVTDAVIAPALLQKALLEA